jgi:hypothetical protein
MWFRGAKSVEALAVRQPCFGEACTKFIAALLNNHVHRAGQDQMAKFWRYRRTEFGGDYF